jgi:tetratricopeptide (TPR) repeat protein/GT2 family glycosyltransferase
VKIHERLAALLKGRPSDEALCRDGLQRQSAGDNAGALRCYQQVLQHSPGFPPALHGAGVIALVEGRIADACSLLEEAARSDPGDVQIQYDLAEACRLALRWQDAVVAYQRVLAAKPDVLAARTGLAECKYSSGQLAEARIHCQQVLQSQTELQVASQPRQPLGDHRALMLAAELALQGQIPDLTEEAYRKALTLDPDNDSLLQGMAKVLVALGKLEAAAVLLRRLLPAGGDDCHLTVIRMMEEAVKRGMPALAGPLDRGSAPSDDDHPLISIIICSIDPRKFEAITAHYAHLLAGERHEIIGIHDAKSLCEGYNRGARRAAGNIIVFSHDDIEILTPDFALRLKRHLASHHVVGACGASRLVSGYWMGVSWPYMHGLVAHHYPEDLDDQEKAGKFRVMVLDTLGDDATGLMQVLDGMFIAARREVVERCPFDEERFDGFHMYDLDFTFSAYLAGYDVAVFRDITMVHYTYASSPGYVEAFDRYRARFEQKHHHEFSAATLEGRRFVPVLFDSKLDVQRFCNELLAFRRNALAAPQAAP